MSALVTPIFSGAINGKPLRFFKAPTDGAHLPWYAWDDLITAVGLPRGLRRHMQASLQRDYGSAIRTVATADGIVTISPHWMAQGFIGSMIEMGHTSAKTEIDYVDQSYRAWQALTAGVPHAIADAMLIEALRNIVAEEKAAS